MDFRLGCAGVPNSGSYYWACLYSLTVRKEQGFQSPPSQLKPSPVTHSFCPWTSPRDKVYYLHSYLCYSEFVFARWLTAIGVCPVCTLSLPAASVSWAAHWSAENTGQMHMYRDASHLCLKARQSRCLRSSFTSRVVGTSMCTAPPQRPSHSLWGLSVQAWGRSQLEMRLTDGTLSSSF